MSEVCTYDPERGYLYYAVSATADGRQVPTFYLSAQTQGIVSADHAERIARDMFAAVNPDADVHMAVVPVWSGERA